MSARWCLAVAAVMLAAVPRLCAADAPQDVVDQSNAGRAEVNWTKGVITVKGVAPPQERAAATNQLALQRRVALVDALRMAIETIKGIHVTSETTVALYQLVSDDIRTKVEGLVRGHRIIREGYIGDTKDYEVVLAIPLTPQPGQPTSLAAVVVPQVQELEPKALELRRKTATPVVPPAAPTTGTPQTGTDANPTAPPTAPPTTPATTPTTPPTAPATPDVAPRIDVPAVTPPPAVALPPRKPGPYTGLLIDATGFQLQRCMCPKIFRRDGVEVWGTVEVSTEFVQETGIAGFVPSLADGLNLHLNYRVGDNPLVIRAIGRQGSVWANAVVSDDDAALIIAENAKTKFLAKFQVTFVVDE